MDTVIYDDRVRQQIFETGWPKYNGVRSDLDAIILFQLGGTKNQPQTEDGLLVRLPASGWFMRFGKVGRHQIPRDAGQIFVIVKPDDSLGIVQVVGVKAEAIGQETGRKPIWTLKL